MYTKVNSFRFLFKFKFSIFILNAPDGAVNVAAPNNTLKLNKSLAYLQNSINFFKHFILITPHSEYFQCFLRGSLR